MVLDRLEGQQPAVATQRGIRMKSVLRTLEVLELVSREQPVSVGELAHQLELPKSTMQRTLVTLHEAGWLRQAPGPVTRWEVSPKILTIRPPVLRDGALISAARGPMESLRDEVDETVFLCIPSDLDGVILIDRVESSQPLRSVAPIGERSPYWSTATGKAILAFLPDAARAAALAADDDFDWSPENVQDLEQELASVRRKGYTTNIGARRRGVSAIGAPVIDRDGAPLASLCISMPSTRFDRRRVKEWGTLVMDAADQIAQRVI